MRVCVCERVKQKVSARGLGRVAREIKIDNTARESSKGMGWDEWRGKSAYGRGIGRRSKESGKGGALYLLKSAFIMCKRDGARERIEI